MLKHGAKSLSPLIGCAAINKTASGARPGEPGPKSEHVLCVKEGAHCTGGQSATGPDCRRPSGPPLQYPFYPAGDCEGQDPVTRAEVRFENGRLRFRCEQAGLDESRPVGPQLGQTFCQWAAGYREARGKADAAERFLGLGRDLYAWLDGGERWLERLRGSASPPLVIEHAVPLRPDEPQLSFLEVPWELLADRQGHLAADARLLYCPVRRVGRATKPAEPSPYRLSVVFMAAAPRGAVPLSFEAEEDAVLRATGSLGLDLTVEESGNLALLAECVAQEANPAPVDVLHVSCHGRSEPEPCLLLEDEEGGCQRATVEELAAQLGDHLPRLLFLSACETAAPGKALLSMAVGMIACGTPAVLGWSGSVQDREATRFAEALYRHLARGAPLSRAVARARLELLNPSPETRDERPSQDWHLARLFLGPAGGGKIGGGRGARHRLDAEYNIKAFLNQRRQTIPVAGRHEFVGRRKQIQTILRVFRRRTHAGVLVQGLGRQGKSSLAARIVHRLGDHTPVVLHGRYDGPAVLEALAVEGSPEVRGLLEDARRAVGDDPAALGVALRQVLEGPCRQFIPQADGRPAQHPVLLVIDDFEQALEPSERGPHRLKPDLVEPVRQVIRAFDEADTESRLLLTCRYTFTLPDRGQDLADRLLVLQLPPMEEYESKKQAQAKLRVSAEARVEPDRLERIIRLARGNPGLQDRLFRMGQEAPDACGRALEQMEAYLAEGAQPDEQQVRDFLENLALDRLVGILSPDERQLLRASTLFEIPVPVAVLAGLADSLGLPHEEPFERRLAGLGLWEYHEDVVDFDRLAVGVNALARPKAGALAPEEEAALAASIVHDLFEGWGGVEGRRRRPYVADLELTRLALLAKSADVLAATAADALLGLEQQFAYRRAAELGRRCVVALDKASGAAPVMLLRVAGERCAAVGDVESARSFYGRALAEVKEASTRNEPVDAGEHAHCLVAHGCQLAQDGKPDEALAEFRAAERLLAEAKMPRERAITLGEIARILRDKGQVDEAMKLHEERLKVYEALGDRGSRAVTLVDIARILRGKGQVDEAMKLHEEALKEYEALGDRRSRAVTLGDIARILTDRGQVDEAMKLHEEQLQEYEALGDRRERAVTLGDIARILTDRGQVDEAMKLHEEVLKEYEALGDQEGIAAALWGVAQIELARQQHEAAAEHLARSYAIFQKIGRLEGICLVGSILGQLLCAAGHKEEGLAILTRSRDGFQKLGRANDAAEVNEMIERIKQR